MKDVTNAIDTMLHVHKASAMPLKGEHISSQWQESTPAAEDQALSVIEHCVQTFGSEALLELEERIERMQEEFLAYVRQRFQKKNINIDEKLILSLSHENTLVLECQEQEDALLALFAEDEQLHQRLQELKSTAFLRQALQYFAASNVQNSEHKLSMYHACLKGKLSHFYLK